MCTLYEKHCLSHRNWYFCIWLCGLILLRRYAGCNCIHYNLYFFWRICSEISILIIKYLFWKILYCCIITLLQVVYPILLFSSFVTLNEPKAQNVSLCDINNVVIFSSCVPNSLKKKNIMFCDIHIWQYWTLPNYIGRKQWKNGTLTEPRIL